MKQSNHTLHSTMEEPRKPLEIARICLVPGVGGYWSQDQAAVQMGAEVDGFFFVGEPVTPGFEAIREPSDAYCVLLELVDGQVAYGDCLTVFNAGHAGRPPPLLRKELPRAQAAVSVVYDRQKFRGFRDAAARLEFLDVEPDIAIPVAYGVSQALLCAASLANHTTMMRTLLHEYGVARPSRTPGLAGSCGGEWEHNVDKAIARRLAMFPQSAIQTRTECERLPEYVRWIRGRLRRLADNDYRPDLHFDFHAALGRAYDNDLGKIGSYLGTIVDLAKPSRVYFEDPLLSRTADEALERMAGLRACIEEMGLDCGLIADEWANAPGGVRKFAFARAAHAIQIKMPDNGSLVNTIEAIRTCQENEILAYLGGSCNETDISARTTVHVGVAFGAWRMLTKPGLGFDEGVMIMTNEMNRVLALT